MSGWSDSGICPKCGSENLMTSGDYKPFDFVSGMCLDCGWYYWTDDGCLSLEEVNEHRKDFEMEPLKELRERVEVK